MNNNKLMLSRWYLSRRSAQMPRIILTALPGLVAYLDWCLKTFQDSRVEWIVWEDKHFLLEIKKNSNRVDFGIKSTWVQFDKFAIVSRATYPSVSFRFKMFLVEILNGFEKRMSRFIICMEWLYVVLTERV